MASDTIDITDEVDTYAKGKTFECDCGQGIGVKLEARRVKCASCGKILEDKKASSREPPQAGGAQATLGAFS